MRSFEEEKAASIAALGADEKLKEASRAWIQSSGYHRYAYNFSYLGRPIIQLPQDIVAMQELIWRVKPDLIIETGIAHGGSLVMSASMLTLLDHCDAVARGETCVPVAPRRKVLGIDIEIRAHNRAAIEAHPLSDRIEMIESSSIAPEAIAKVHERAQSFKSVLVCLDSNHTHAHVLAELTAYAPLVTPGSYCVVFDTVVEDIPADLCLGRPWGKGNNPRTAVWEYLRRHSEFEIDKTIEDKLLITVAPDGYLKRVR